MKNFKSMFKTAIEACRTEIQALDVAKNALAAKKEALLATRKSVDDLTRSSDKARVELSEAAGRGMNVTEHVRTRARITAEIIVMNELVTDMECNDLPEAEREVKKAEALLASKITAKLSEAVHEAQIELDELFIQVARRIDEFWEEYKNTCKEYPEAAFTSYTPSLKWRDTRPALTEEGNMSGDWR